MGLLTLCFLVKKIKVDASEKKKVAVDDTTKGKKSFFYCSSSLRI